MKILLNEAVNNHLVLRTCFVWSCLGHSPQDTILLSVGLPFSKLGPQWLLECKQGIVLIFEVGDTTF